MAYNAKNMVSTEYTGGHTFPAVANRTYFFIVMTAGTGTVSFGGGDGEIPLGTGTYYEPLTCPLSEVKVTTTGTYVVCIG